MEKDSRMKPIVLAINICDDIIRDEISKKMSLIGLFNRIQSPSFPATHSSLHVYVSLTNGHKRYKGELRFANESDNNVIFKTNTDVPLQNPLQTLELNFSIRNLKFDKPGNYSLQFYCDGTLVGSRRFIVSMPMSSSKTKR